MSGRIFELDLLRGIAILLVMGVHVPAYPIWSTSGWIGVDLFFVLSGFLISNLLFSEYRSTGNIRLGRFFFRRALKLYPSFYLLLGSTLAYCALTQRPFTARQVIGEAILTQNYIGALWGHTWSLAVEEHFYLYLPLALALFMAVDRHERPARPFGQIPWLFAVTAASCLLARIVNAPAVYDHRSTYELTHLRIDSLLAGVLIGYLHNFRPELLRKLMSRPYRYPLSIASVLSIAPAIVLEQGNPILYTIGFTLLYIGFGIVLCMALYPEHRRPAAAEGHGAAAALIAELGTYSYTVYLWHVPMAMVFAAAAGRFPGVNPFALHAVYFAASIAAGVLAAKLIERPVLRLRDRVFQRPPATAAAERIAA